MPQIYTFDAVFDYQKHEYIYMCAREDFSGNHNFATNLTDHNRNAQRYQKALTLEIQKGKQQKQINVYIRNPYTRTIWRDRPNGVCVLW
ncbi:MAG: hypothetical protein U5K54_15580 [Cytophagales bacterium]|nr:hypothetical protein [Cytophagales bacterium]